MLCIYVGGVVKDQAEADKDMNWKQRVALAAGSDTRFFAPSA